MCSPPPRVRCIGQKTPCLSRNSKIYPNQWYCGRFPVFAAWNILRPMMPPPTELDLSQRGTFGSTAIPIRVPDFANSGEKQNKITAVLRSILDALGSDSDCSNWLKGGGSAGGDLIQALLENNTYGYGTFNVNTTAAIAGGRNADGSLVGVPVDAAFTINSTGAFFSEKAANGVAFSVGYQKYRGNTIQAQAAILIHELGHILGTEGFQSDFAKPQAVKDNDKLVDKHCGKLIGGLR